MAINNENEPVSTLLSAGSVAASLAAGTVHRFKRKTKIQSLYLADVAGIPASNTNYAVATLKVGATTVASYDTRAAGQGALTANVPGALSIVSGQETQAAGAALTLEITLAGSTTLTRAMLQMDSSPL